MSTGILRPGPRLGSRERKAIDMLNIRPRDYIPNPAEERHGFAEDPDKEMDNSWWHLDEHDHHNEESPSTFHTRQYQFNADVQVDEEVKHFNRFLWSCRALRTFEMALYSSNRKLLCAYCGTLMGWQIHENTKVRQRVRGQSHLRMVHRFGECNQQNTYASKKDFYQHLVDFHAASVSGAWIITLDNACAFELPGSAKALFSAVASSLNFTTAKLEKLWDTFKPPSNQHFSSRTKSAIVNYLLRGPYDDLSFAQLISQMRLAALCKDEIHLLNLVLSNWPLEHGETINSVARSMLMQRRIDLKMIRTGILKTTAADARREPQSSNEKEKNILRQWERTLGEKSMDEFRESSANFAIRLQSYNDSLLSTWTGSRDRVNRWLLHTLGSSAEQANIHLSMMHDPKTSMKYWSRLVLKYWFLDEAALGIEFEPSPSLGAAHSPDSSSLWSSEFASCKSHLTEAVVLREDEEHGRECATGPASALGGDGAIVHAPVQCEGGVSAGDGVGARIAMYSGVGGGPGRACGIEETGVAKGCTSEGGAREGHVALDAKGETGLGEDVGIEDDTKDGNVEILVVAEGVMLEETEGVTLEETGGDVAVIGVDTGSGIVEGGEEIGDVGKLSEGLVMEGRDNGNVEGIISDKIELSGTSDRIEFNGRSDRIELIGTMDGTSDRTELIGTSDRMELIGTMDSTSDRIELIGTMDCTSDRIELIGTMDCTSDRIELIGTSDRIELIGTMDCTSDRIELIGIRDCTSDRIELIGRGGRMPSDVAGATAGVDIKGEESDRTFREVVGDSGMTEAGRSVVGLSTEAGRSGVMTDTMGKGGSRASSDVAGATAGVAAGVDIKGGESDGIFTEVAGDSVGSGVEVIKVGSGEVDGTFSGAERETMGIDVVGAESVGMLSDAGRDTRGIVTEGTGLGGRSTEIGRDVAGIEVDGAAAGGIKSEVGTGSAGINVEAREVGRTLMGAGIGAVGQVFGVEK
ncbi:MAG: hypothetical protein Q9157_007730 [Trypethelium eluteriae]